MKQQQQRYSLFRHQQHHTTTTSITHTSKNKSTSRRICCCIGRWNIMIYSFIIIMMIIQVLQILFYVNDNDNLIRTITTIPYNRSTGIRVSTTTTKNFNNNNDISRGTTISVRNNTIVTTGAIPLSSNSTRLSTSSILFSMKHPNYNDENEDWHVHIAHEPRYDLLGSFVIPTLLLLAVTNYYNTNNNYHHYWELIILPFLGTQQHAILQDLVKLGNKIDTAWGSGFQDANHRSDYDPVQLNAESYQNIGFFPNVSNNNILSEYPWIRKKKVPKPGKELNDLCNITTNTETETTRNIPNSQSNKHCYILLSDEPQHIRAHIDQNGGMGKFFNPTFCQHIRDQFLHHNAYRLHKYYQNYNITIRTCYGNNNNSNHNNNHNHINSQSSNYTNCHTNTNTDTSTTNLQEQHDFFHVAMHIRRGDILNPDRWTDQTVFANVGRTICEQNKQLYPTMKTYIHVFSSGPNRDGDWTVMESIGQMNINTNISIMDNDDTYDNMTTSSSLPPPCTGVYFHLNEIEYDSWTFMIAADALVISKSTFSYVPALIRYHNVYMPLKYWYPNLPSFHVFNDTNGEILW